MVILLIFTGSSHLYVFVNPNQKKSDADLPEEITWDFAQKEIAQASGYATDTEGLTKGRLSVKSVLFITAFSLHHFLWYLCSYVVTYLLYYVVML